MLLTREQLQCFEDSGYLILRDILSEQETKDLQQWAQEVHDWPTDENSPWMPYEVVKLGRPWITEDAKRWTRRSTLRDKRCCVARRTMRTRIQVSMVFSAERSC